MDNPNNTLIEINSISHLKLALLKSRKVKPSITENDKTPSWDGNIEIYSNNSFNKSNLVGIIPVQVKGVWSDDLSKGSIKYSTNISDLKNYQNNNGAIFFVVYCNDSGAKIYYNMLLPMDLDNILKSAKGETKSIDFNSFPTDDGDKIYRLFCEFLYHSRRQGQRDAKIQELFREGKLDIPGATFTIGYGGALHELEEDTIKYILNNPTYVYIKPEGFNVNIVLDKVNMVKFSRELKMPLIIDDEVIYNKVVEEIDSSGKKFIHIGENIIWYDYNKMKFKSAPYLSTRIKDLKVIIHFMRMEYLHKEGDVKLTFNDGTIISLSNFEKMLASLIEIQNLLDSFGVKKDLLLDDMDDEDTKKLDALGKSVMHLKPVPYSIDGKEGIGTIEFSNIKLLIRCTKTDKNGYFMISNFFADSNGEVLFQLKEQEKSFTGSPYVHILKRDNLTTIDNIDFSEIVKSVMMYEHCEEYDYMINAFILELISAYDSTKTSNIMLLESADTLLDFLIDSPCNAEGEPAYLINKLQIKKRRFQLTYEDELQLFGLKIKHKENEILLLCVNILLESYLEAGLIYEGLGKEEREDFDKYPINFLWKKDNIISQ